MANRKTKYKTITHIPGQIRVTLPNGTRKTFQNSADALAFFDLNFGEGYSMEITSTTDNNGEVTINGGELPEVTVVGKAPDKPKEPEPVDPIREAIFEGRYNGSKFAPTPANIQHFLDLYESDKRIAEGYGNKAWGKVLGTHLAAAGGIYAGLTAPAWLPWAWKTGAPLFAKHVAAPTAAGMIWDEGLRALTGTTTTEQISNWLLKEKGWNPTMADMAGGLSNPGYWINFGGTGLYTRPLFNKIGLGLANPAAPIELSPTILANINAMMPKSKLLTKVIDPALAWTDRNLHKLQVATNPWLLRYKPTTISLGDLPRFKFVDDPSKLQPISEYVTLPGTKGLIWDYLLFKSNSNNERVFGDAMRLLLPLINKTTFYKKGFNSKPGRLDLMTSPLLTGLAATDLVLSDSEDRNPVIRGLEYALLGRYGLNKFIQRRASNTVSKIQNYLNEFIGINTDIGNFFRRNPLRKQPEGYSRYWNGDLGASRMFVKLGTHQATSKPGFNYKNASFDDLVRFLDRNGTRKTELAGFTIDNNKLYNPSGTAIAERSADGKIKLLNETELRNILAKDIDIVDYATGNRYTGRISVGDDGTVNIPEEYTNTLRNNIDYVLNTLFPGSGVKVFGSSAGVTEAGFPHATHDVDFYITLNEIDKLLANGMLKKSDKINPGTYTYRLKPSEFGEQGNIDLNVLELTPEGMATGIRAEELFRQYFPEDYFKALREFKAELGNGTAGSSMTINKTPEELLEAMNPSSKTIMDSFDIDYTASAKGKHALRSWAHLVYSDPQQVSQGINLYAQSMLGSRVRLFPITAEQLGDKELNLQALLKLGVNLGDFELLRIASDPQRMKNVLDAWYMMDNTAMRYIKGTWPGTTGYSPENFVKSATIWDPINNGGNARGAGLNTTIGGDSGFYGDLKAFISPNTLYKSTGLLDLIDEVNYNFGRHPDAPAILKRIPRQGEEAASLLLKVYDNTGWNFLQDGRSYTRSGPDRYASATRPFDINTDFIGFTPTKTKLNALIPRINTPEKNNPLAMTGYEAPFASRREVPAITDYYYARTSSLSPVFLANNNRYWTYSNPIKGLGKHDFIPWKWEAIMGGSVPGLAGVGYGITEYDSYRRRNWILNAITSPDEVILNMPDKDRIKFTQQGVDSLKQNNKQWYGEDASDDDLMRGVYWNLKSVYDGYNTK